MDGKKTSELVIESTEVLRDEDDQRIQADCTLLGRVEYVIGEIGRKYGSEVQYSIKLTENPKEDGVARRYHVYMTGMLVCSLEDEEQFFCEPILFTQPRLRIVMDCSRPESGTVMELLLSVPKGGCDEDGRYPVQLYNPRAAANLYASLCVLIRHEIPINESVDLLTSVPDEEEPIETRPLLPSPPPPPPPQPAQPGYFESLIRICTRGKPPAAAAAAAAAARDAPVHKPDASRVVRFGAPIVNPDHKVPETKRFVSAEFPLGVPKILTRRHVSEEEMSLLEQQLVELLQCVCRSLVGPHTDLRMDTHANLHMDCGTVGNRYYLFYAYGYHSLTIFQQRHIVLAFPSRISKVEVDVATKCLMVWWVRMPLAPDCYWSMRPDTNGTRMSQIYVAQSLPVVPRSTFMAPTPPVAKAPLQTVLQSAMGFLTEVITDRPPAPPTPQTNILPPSAVLPPATLLVPTEESKFFLAAAHADQKESSEEDNPTDRAKRKAREERRRRKRQRSHSTKRETSTPLVVRAEPEHIRGRTKETKMEVDKSAHKTDKSVSSSTADRSLSKSGEVLPTLNADKPAPGTPRSSSVHKPRKKKKHAPLLTTTHASSFMKSKPLSELRTTVPPIESTQPPVARHFPGKMWIAPK